MRLTELKLDKPMRSKSVLTIVFSFSLLACGNEKKSERHAEKPIREKITRDSLIYDRIAEMYQYKNQYADSTLILKIWYLNDSVVKKEGTSKATLPFQHEYISGHYFIQEYLFEQLQGKTYYYFMDSMICEAGGMSGHNKYYIKYNAKKLPVEIKHYDAQYRSYEDGHVYKNPKFSLKYTMKFAYSDTSITTIITDFENNLADYLYTRLDKDSNIVYQENIDWEDTCRVFYTWLNSARKKEAMEAASNSNDKFLLAEINIKRLLTLYIQQKKRTYLDSLYLQTISASDGVFAENVNEHFHSFVDSANLECTIIADLDGNRDTVMANTYYTFLFHPIQYYPEYGNKIKKLTCYKKFRQKLEKHLVLYAD